ncbi:MAG: hypothetical protein GDA43_16990 [Hormoscilla sp. SP5CHS1]|nr:hypothetical protein [Hormoscilla sp. SP5CHS1]
MHFDETSKNLDIVSSEGSTEGSTYIEAYGVVLAELPGVAYEDIDVPGNFVKLP